MLSLADLPVVPPDDNEPARLEGSFEDQFFKPITTDFRRLFMNAIHKFERDSRAKGRRNGKLGHVGVEVADFLVSLSLNCRGRLYPPVQYIMDRLRRSRDAVVRALNALRAFGFLKRIKRFKRTPMKALGPQVEWTSNAYRVEIPEAAAKLFGRMMARLLPVDETERKKAMLATIRAYEADQVVINQAAKSDAFDQSPAGRAIANAIARSQLRSTPVR